MGKDADAAESGLDDVCPEHDDDEEYFSESSFGPTEDELDARDADRDDDTIMFCPACGSDGRCDCRCEDCGRLGCFCAEAKADGEDRSIAGHERSHGPGSL